MGPLKTVVRNRQQAWKKLRIAISIIKKLALLRKGSDKN
jgi:hypothetical protein